MSIIFADAVAFMPDYPRMEEFDLPSWPEFPNTLASEVFQLCRSNYLSSSRMMEAQYQIRDLYQCDLRPLWKEKSEKDGIKFPVILRPDDPVPFHGELRKLMVSTEMEGKEDAEMKMKDKMMKRNHDLYHDSQSHHHYDDEKMEKKMQHENSHHYGDDEERKEEEKMKMNEMGEMEKRLEREENLKACKKAELSEFCFIGDLIVSCMHDGVKEIVDMLRAREMEIAEQIGQGAQIAEKEKMMMKNHEDEMMMKNHQEEEMMMNPHEKMMEDKQMRYHDKQDEDYLHQSRHHDMNAHQMKHHHDVNEKADDMFSGIRRQASFHYDSPLMTSKRRRNVAGMAKDVMKFLAEDLCENYGMKTLECQKPMETLGFTNWPMTMKSSSMAMRNEGFAIEGCK